MAIGHIIRKERLNQNMKQSYLAKDICSPSYLSKIENNSTQPSEEVLELLLDKLGIEDLINIKESDESKQKEYLLKIYKHITINRDENYAKETLNKLEALRFSFSNSHFYLYCLIHIRLSFFLNNDKNSSDYLDLLLIDKEKLNEFETYLLYKMLGIYWHKNNNQESIDNLEKALECSISLNLSNWEKADIYYMYSLSSISNKRNIDAIKYSKQALKYFNESFQFKRSIEALLIQGIAYKNSFKFKEALRCYEKALEIVETFQIYKYKASIFQNLGSLYMKNMEYNTALDYFTKSLDLKESIEARLITIFSLIQVYSILEDHNKMNIWIKKGLNEINETSEFISYKYHFNIYKLLAENNLIKIEEYLTRAIKYFEDKKDYRHCYKYCIKIGEILQNRKKYKNSSLYYKKATEYRNKMDNILIWEDI